jgi:hypothetical protein
MEGGGGAGRRVGEIFRHTQGRKINREERQETVVFIDRGNWALEPIATTAKTSPSLLILSSMIWPVVPHTTEL